MSNTNSNSTEVITANLLRFAGYGLLLLAFSNFFDAIIPPQFGKDAPWEFSTLGKLVGTSPVPIIGLILIFYGESTARSPFGKKILKFLSWLSLLLSIIYVLMLLVGISAAIRINNDNNNQASFTLSQQLAQFNTAKENLKNTNDTNLLRAAEFIEKRSPNIKLNKSNPAELRKQLETEIGKNEEAIKANIDTSRGRAFRQLIKQAIKWYFEAIVSAVVLFGIWSQTKWARTSIRRKKKSKTSTSLGDIAGTPTLDLESPNSQSKDSPSTSTEEQN
ncbi:HpsJ family protein [Pseudanabaena sp. 'Roaring Creek']|uniref:HpsJ-like protein, cyanoexosortase A-associated n=1 Tax=Pseudanabaena sp. 'Roaring Creek' TaxID=1681830 RepID=UPI0006D802D1|nr:HpsJ family protein [Pseudanabaena sp. 'Roaring Creek']